MHTKQSSRFVKYQSLYLRLHLVITIMSIILLALGYVFVQMINSAPTILLYASTALLYYLIVHFSYGVFSLIYYLSKLKGSIKKMRIYQTVIALLTTPLVAIVLYIAILLLSFSQCVSD